MAHHWDYEGENGNWFCFYVFGGILIYSAKGPSNWHKEFPLAAAKHQSPINIDTSAAVFNEELTKVPLDISYDSLDLSSIQNNGHTFQITGKLNESSIYFILPW